jgi:hypothetical protein
MNVELEPIGFTTAIELDDSGHSGAKEIRSSWYVAPSFCFHGFLLGSTFRECSIILLSTSHMSFADQSKTSLF